MAQMVRLVGLGTMRMFRRCRTGAIGETSKPGGSQRWCSRSAIRPYRSSTRLVVWLTILLMIAPVSLAKMPAGSFIPHERQLAGVLAGPTDFMSAAFRDIESKRSPERKRTGASYLMSRQTPGSTIRWLPVGQERQFAGGTVAFWF